MSGGDQSAYIWVTDCITGAPLNGCTFVLSSGNVSVMPEPLTTPGEYVATVSPGAVFEVSSPALVEFIITAPALPCRRAT